MTLLLAADTASGRKAERRRRIRVRPGRLIAGVALIVIGLAGLLVAYLLVYGPYPWDPMLFGVGIPGGLMLQSAGICLFLIGAWLATSAFRRTS